MIQGVVSGEATNFFRDSSNSTVRFSRVRVRRLGFDSGEEHAGGNGGLEGFIKWAELNLRYDVLARFSTANKVITNLFNSQSAFFSLLSRYGNVGTISRMERCGIGKILAIGWEGIHRRLS